MCKLNGEHPLTVLFSSAPTAVMGQSKKKGEGVIKSDIEIYYINTSEISGELLCEKHDIFTHENNMLFSPNYEKITSAIAT